VADDPTKDMTFLAKSMKIFPKLKKEIVA